MRVFTPSLLLISIALVWADDRTTCEKFCNDTYNGEEADGCQRGCGFRSQTANVPGAYKMIGCFRMCHADNELKDEGKKACGEACGLPWVSSVFFSMTRGDDGKQNWKVVQANGDEVKELTNDNGDKMLDEIFLKPLRDQGLLNSQAMADSSEEDDSSEELINGDIGSLEWKKNLFQKIMDQMKGSFDDDFKNIAIERPSGHNPYANQIEKAPRVADMSVWQSPADDQHHLKQANWSWMIRRDMMIIFLLMSAILLSFLTLFCLCFRMQRPQSPSYRRIWSDRIPVWGRVQGSDAGPIPVKKIPEDSWAEHTEPIGIAPPAYDQVSIHKSPDSDASTAEAQTPSPIHP